MPGDAVSADGTRNAMDVDVKVPEQLHSLLLSPAKCKHPDSVSEALDQLNIKPFGLLSRELQFLKELKPKEPQPLRAGGCGMTLYSLEHYPSERVLELRKRASELYFERDFYANLYDAFLEIWKDEDRTRRKKIILTGNAGVGKSWFQVYLLRRLLTETGDRMFRFVVRHVGKDFRLLDLETCYGNKLSGSESDIRQFLGDHGSILYLYEPFEHVDQPPLVSEAPCLATLSPRKKRIKEYLKENPHLLYTPVGEYNELECIAEEEGLDLDFMEKSFEIFGGIFRHSLVHTALEREVLLKSVKARCNAVSADMLRSIAADIDDDRNSDLEGNISGFILSYIDIPLEGGRAFRLPSLALTSDYVRQSVMDKMSFTSYEEHLKMLDQVLKDKSSDPTGKDLEESVVHMLAAGPAKVRWQYRGVHGELDTSMKVLGHTKRDVTRETFDASLVNYPSDTSFPLADCVLVINGDFWAFQTTWQYSHAFKLRTLRSFRDKLQLPIGSTLNLLFVNPAHDDAYESRHRNNYLAKGEDPTNPILDNKKRVVMGAQDVATMWENTRIFVAFPKNKDWHAAIKSVMGVDP